MSFTGEDQLTIGVCEVFFEEASQVFAGRGWRGVQLISFPSRCGRPTIAEEEVNILPQSSVDFVLIGGKCLSELQTHEGIHTFTKSNCLHYFCGAPLLQQLLETSGYVISPGWLRRWKSGDESDLSQLHKRVVASGSKKVVLLDSLVDEKAKEYFEELIERERLEGDCVEVGCDYFSLYLHSIVSDWQMARESRRLQLARTKSSEATLILNLLAQLEPAISLEKAEKQLDDLFKMFMAAEQVGVEIISNAVTNFRFAEDQSALSLASFSNSGLYKSDTIRGFYLLVPIDKAKSAVVRVAGIYLDSNMDDYMALSLSLKGLIRLILYNGILYNDLHAEIVHKAQIEKYLEKSENHFRFLYENAPLPYHSLDKNGDILEVNNAWLQAVGLQKKGVIGLSFEQFLDEESIEDYRGFLAKICGDSESCSIELGVLKNDSTPIRIHLDATTTTDSDGNVHQIHCIFVDISEKKRIKELILQSEKLSTIAGLAAGIAHEINTPLSGILQSAQLIEMFLNPDNEQSLKAAAACGVDLVKVKEYTDQQELDYFIGGIRNSAVTASEIIKNLLEFSRPSKGEWASIRLSHLLDRIVKLILSDYDLKKKYNVINVAFETEYDANLPFIYCVSVEIEQVFFNIIKNAVHAMGQAATKNPKVIIRTRLEKHTARIEIEDNGPGIERETMKHAFDPFFTTKDPGEGTGLGLSISYAIVVGKHSGLIWVDPDVNKGTRFVIELPVETRSQQIN